MAIRDTFTAFRHRNFKILFTVSFFTNVGTWSQRVAQDWLVLQLSGSGRELGLVTALQFFPTLILSLLGGLLADRFSKRKLLMITNFGSGISAGILGALVLNDSVQMWHVYVLALTLGIFSAIDAPIRQSFTSEVVGKTDLANAVSLNSANFNLGRLVGPGLAGLSIAAFGTGPSFLVNAASYLIVIGGLLVLRESDLHLQKREEIRATLKEAFQYVRQNNQILALMIVVFFGATFGLNFQIFNALMATSEFHKGPAQFGALGSTLAIGSLTGALLTARLPNGRTPRRIMGFAILFGSALIGISFAPTYLAYSFVLPIAGALAITTMVSSNSYVQTNTEPRMRGRVMGIYLTVFMGGTPVGAPIVGYLSTAFGIRDTMRICGLITVLATLSAMTFLKRRQEELTASESAHPQQAL